jgi:branched-chain amino acid transport system ATP-binding protein
MSNRMYDDSIPPTLQQSHRFLQRQQPLLEVKDLCVSFGGVHALSGLSFEMRRGEILGLIGPNGAGKSTLFNCISRLYQHSSGDILIEGSSILKRKPHHMASLGIGRTFQNVSLFTNLSVADNIRIGAHARTKSGIVGNALRMPWTRREERTLAERVNIIIAYLGLEDVSTMTVASLPFGTQKRVELGRALASEPKILILDEPACGLNHDEVYVLGDLIPAQLSAGIGFEPSARKLRRPLQPIRTRAVILGWRPPASNRVSILASCASLIATLHSRTARRGPPPLSGAR